MCRQYIEELYIDGFLCPTSLFVSRGVVLDNKEGLQHPGCLLLEVDYDLNVCDFHYQISL